MSFATKASIFIGAAAFSGMAVAGTGDASNDLQSRLEAAEARIADLSAQQNGDWLTEQRGEQIRGIVQDVLADADTRASLQGNGATSGYDNGFFVQSADGKWSMKINGLFQERWNLGHQSGGGTASVANPTPWNAVDTGGNYNTAFGFETTRAVLQFSGELAGVAFYNARLDWSPYNGGDNVYNTSSVTGGVLSSTANTGAGLSNDPLEWAYGGWHVDDTWSVQIGRQKFDVMRGFMVNAEDQQAIERSSQTYYWNTSSITNGIKLVGNTDQARYNVMFSNGAGSAIGGGAGNNTWNNNAHGWAVTGRGEWLLEGQWDQFDRMGSSAGETDAWLLGVGAGYLRNQNQSEDNWLVSADLSYEADGWNAYGSVTAGNNNNVPNGIITAADGNTVNLAGTSMADGNDGTSIGWEVGAGYYLMEDTELYGRWQWLSPGVAIGGDISPVDGGPSSKLNIATIGVNHYIAGPNTKLSADWSWCFTDPSLVNGLGGGAWGPTGWWATGNQTTGSLWLLRTQLQISF